MSANVFSLTPLATAAVKEIEARSKTNASQAWFATKTNWVHVESYCDQCGRYGVMNAFHKQPYEGNYSGRPNPVIDSVQVKAQGNLGTTRQATIKFIAFTQEQINGLANCYGVPGMSIRIQFGWNRAADGTVTDSIISGAMRDAKAICKINRQREKSAGYDGLQGKVAKYSITFLRDMMAWEMIVDVVAASSPVLTRPVEDMSTMCYCDSTAVDPKTNDKKTTNHGMSLFRSHIVNVIENLSSISTLPTGVYKIHLNHASRDVLGTSTQGMISKFLGFFGNTPETDEAYITFGALEQMLNDYSQAQADGKPLMARFDSSHAGLITYKEPGHSADPDICLFPGIDYAQGEGYEGIGKAPTCHLRSSDGSVDGIDITRVLFNCIYINKCIEDIGKDGSIQDFFEKLFQGLSTATGGLFELSVVDVAGCDGDVPVLSVIDVQKAKTVSPTMIKVDPSSAVVRDIKLEMKLTDAMMAQALYADVRQNTTTKQCEEKGYIKELSGYKNLAEPASTEKPKGPCAGECKSKEEHEAEKNIEDDYKSLVDEITDETKETLRGRLVDAYNKNAENDVCKDMIKPYEMSLTLDGIGGIGFGQAITCNLLPDKVQKRYVYQVTAVEHSISYGDWTTTINTKARYSS